MNESKIRALAQQIYALTDDAKIHAWAQSGGCVEVAMNDQQMIKSGNAMRETSRPLANHLFGGDMVVKKCSKCAVVKPVAEFSKSVQQKDGLQSWCKSCCQADHVAHREKWREYDRRYAERHPGVKAERSRRHRETYPERRAEQCKRYRATKPDVVAAHHAVSHAIKDGRLTKEPCFCCGSEAVYAHHSSYSPDMWLAVTWLCKRHHAQVHRKS